MEGILRKKLSNRHDSFWQKKLSKEELDFIIKWTSFLQEDAEMSLRRYYFCENIKEPIRCPVCNRILNFSNIRKTFCSKECKLSDRGKMFTKEKTKQTNLEKYGVENPLSSNDIREQIKKTNLEKYGVENPSQNENIKNKIKQTNLEKYGVENPNQNEEVLNKRKKTNLEKYGVENPNQNEEVLNKRKKTNLEKYGCESVLQNKEIREKIKQTNLEKYGVTTACQRSDVKEKVVRNNLEKYGVRCVLELKEIRDKGKEICKEKYGAECLFQLEDIREQIKQTNLEKYGVENPSQSKEIREKIKKTNLEKYGVENPMQYSEFNEKMKSTMKNRYGAEFTSQSEELLIKKKKSFRVNYIDSFKDILNQKNLEPLFNDEDYINVDINSKLKFRCKECGEIFELDGFTITSKLHCPNPVHSQISHAECEVAEWVESLGYKTERNKRDWSRAKAFEADIFLTDHNLAIEYNGLYWHSNLYRDSDYHFNKWKFFKERNIQCIQIFENEWRDNKEIVKNIILNKLNLLQPLNETDYHLDFVGDNEFISFLQQNSLCDCIDSKNKLGIYTFNKELIQVLSYSILDDKILIDNFCTKLGIKFDEGLKAFTNYLKQTYDKDIYIEIDCRYFDRNDFKGFEFVERTEPKCYYFKNNVLYENKIDDDCLSIYDCGNDIMTSKH